MERAEVVAERAERKRGKQWGDISEINQKSGMEERSLGEYGGEPS